MEVPMTFDETQDRGKFWPIVLVLLGCMNLTDFFYKSAFQAHDLLQGLGFLLGAPLAYFAPARFASPFKRALSQRHRGMWIASLVGLVLVATGIALDLQWL
jgi:short subunit fatty acids transporter